MIIGESFQMVANIGKLTPSWKEFKNYFKHNSKKTGVEDLILRLRVKKKNKLYKKRAISFDIVPKKKTCYEGDKY